MPRERSYTVSDICLLDNELSLLAGKNHPLENNTATKKGQYTISYAFFGLHTAHVPKFLYSTLYTINFYFEFFQWLFNVSHIPICISTISYTARRFFLFTNTDHIQFYLMYTDPYTISWYFLMTFYWCG